MPTPTTPGHYWLNSPGNDIVVLVYNNADTLRYMLPGVPGSKLVTMFPEDDAVWSWGDKVEKCPNSSRRVFFTIHRNEAFGETDTLLCLTKEDFDDNRRKLITRVAEGIEQDHEMDLADDPDTEPDVDAAELRDALNLSDTDQAWDVFQTVNARRNDNAEHGGESYYHTEQHEVDVPHSVRTVEVDPYGGGILSKEGRRALKTAIFGWHYAKRFFAEEYGAYTDGPPDEAAAWGVKLANGVTFDVQVFRVEGKLLASLRACNIGPWVEVSRWPEGTKWRRVTHMKPI